ncbi:MAG: SagB/ThcOx family dehydrogenase [Candidatus Heimdallarchaeota archaeon]|nr:MAG: SagB/ThcOx family dehydrogenase [Candidatus Heimdallarchaeota archaeon]
MEKYRKYLKAHNWDETPEIIPDQQKGVAPPPFQKPCPKKSAVIDLIPLKELSVGNIPLINAINARKSRRGYTNDPFTLEELSFLLWVTQGVREIDIDRRHGKIKTTKRTVPSGGSRHPYETYLVVNRVIGLQPGIYRYLAIEHKLCVLSLINSDLAEKMIDSCHGQKFAGRAAIVFIWAVIPYRIEWRYSIAAHKGIAIEAGHICQNLYLACEAIGAGTCAIAAYDQGKIDSIIGVDGEDEFTVYIAPVGKIKERK